MQSKKQWVKSDSKDFAALGAFVGPFDAKGRTESAALLIWFLQTVYRLDDVEAEDAVCDRKHDEGFDALFVNDSRREVAVFQCKRREKLPATLGDVDLKNFVGSLAHLKTKTAIKHLANTTKNDQLARLIKKLDIAEKVGAGYSVRPVFVCNVAADANALKYLPQAEGVGTPLDLWDLQRLGPVLKQLARDWFIDEQSKLKTSAERRFVIGPKTQPKLVYAAVKARELVKLPGIDDLRLFAQNVRVCPGTSSGITKFSEHEAD